MKTWKEVSVHTGQEIDEDAPANAAGGGAIAGLGVDHPDYPGRGEPGKKKKKKSSSAPNSESSGSGFLISKLGHVVTNNHVVAGCKRVLVGDNPNQLVATSVLETDSSNDLAILRINATESDSYKHLTLPTTL